MSDTRAGEPYLRVHHIPVHVRDQDRSLRFFRDQLGFDLITDQRVEEHGRFILAGPRDGGVPLSLLAALVLRSDGSFERLGSTSTVLGLFGRWECTVEERTFASGDTLVAYTDGVTEASNADGEEFGERRLVEALIPHRTLAAQSLLEKVVAGIRQFSSNEQTDDLTLIVARCR